MGLSGARKACAVTAIDSMLERDVLLVGSHSYSPLREDVDTLSMAREAETPVVADRKF
jgi:hypothetical protein